MATAPVCNTAIPGAVNQPTPKTLPAIPTATDLASALTAIQAITKIVQTLLQGSGSAGGGITGFKTQSGSKASNNFTEVASRRVTKTVRIYNPSDQTQYVDVQQVSSVTMQDPMTGQTWTWTR